MTSLLALKRLRVMQGGHAAYDEEFHLGVNIIRGDNGSGKSTIADFIFFALGGEFDSWKDSARRCDEVQAELQTATAVLTVKRSIASKLEPAFVYFGSMNEAERAGLDGWQRFTIRRTSETSLSFSQVLFRSSLIPEAPTVGGSNVTCHQILRLLYGDQQTPAGKLFRFEAFDTREIRQAVGDLLIGLNSYELYDSQLKVRQLKTEYAEKDRLYAAAVGALPSSEGLSNIQALESRIREASESAEVARAEIAAVDSLVEADQTAEFVEGRQKARKSLQSLSTALEAAESKLQGADYELGELNSFLLYLQELQAKLSVDDNIAAKLGDLEFRYCPSCLRPLAEHYQDHCVVCGQPLEEQRQRSRYLEIRVDNELQIRETRALIDQNNAEQSHLHRQVRDARRSYRDQLASFVATYDVSSSPRESFLAERNQTLGRVEREIAHLEELRAALLRIEQLSKARAELNEQIAQLDARITRLQANSRVRTNSAMTIVDEIGKSLLRGDLRRQEEFIDPKTFSLSFGDDAILVDGRMNFAESSNVIAKNAALVSLWSAATLDSDFWHPRFLLMDNIEDKGMQEERSRNFQRLVVERAAAAKFPHQVIFTTSMMNPELDQPALTVGPLYTSDNKTLRLL